MKTGIRKVNLLFLASFSLVLLSAALLYGSNSHIASVVVYQDRAQITRTLSLRASAGQQLIVFSDLPRQIQEQSLRASAKGAAEVQITGIELKSIFLEESPDQRVNELQTQIQALQDELDTIEAKKGILKTKRDFIESIRVGYSEKLSKEFAAHPAGPAEFAQMVEYLGNSLTNIVEEQGKLELQRRDFAARLDARKNELAKTQSDERKESLAAEIGLSVQKPGDVQLELSYVISSASWSPVYDARLMENGTDLELSYKAIVTQTTGEDWNNVDLTLSTARAALAGNPPTLFSWMIQLRAPALSSDRYNIAGSESGQQAMFNVADQTLTIDTKKTAFVPMETQHTSVLFHIPGKKDVLSDGSPHSVDIAVLPLKADLEYFAIPKLAPDVYLRSEISNTSSTPFLPGRVNVFLGNSYAGVSTMPVAAPAEKFRLYFGVDPDIKVKRSDLAKSKEAGVIGKSRKNYSFRIEAQNFKPVARRVVLIDQLPVSVNEELKVEVDEINPEPVEQNDDGLVKWILELQPQEKKSVDLQFHVTFPKDRQVAGL